MAVIASRYIPMYIVTVLKFRSGLLPSLNDEKFPDYGNNVDTVRLILGQAFWGPLVSSSLLCCIIVGLVFCFTDPVSQVVVADVSMSTLYAVDCHS